MTTHTRCALLALALLPALLLLAGSSAAQVDLPEGMTEEELADIQRRLAVAAQPGPEHALMETLTGEWDQVLRMTPAPGAEVMTMEGIATSEMILGGALPSDGVESASPGSGGRKHGNTGLRPEIR